MSDRIALPFQNPALTASERAADLVGRMTLGEKASQLVNGAPAIPRLGVPEYDWWNEGLHGVGRAGIATVFPQAIGLAATWNVELMERVAGVISVEARAKHHEFIRAGDRGRYKGLTYWSPNINIFRDPRWGRGQETYGEDPFLTSRMGVAFVRGLQGPDPAKPQVIATPKHFAIHSGPEAGRLGFNVSVSPRDLWETYLPAFEACIVEAKACSIMSAYNAIDGVPCSANAWLLEDILRKRWGFTGYVVSDCGAIESMALHHRAFATHEEASAAAIRNGCDLQCGESSRTAVPRGVESGLLSVEDVDRALVRLFTARYLLGMLGPAENSPHERIPITMNDCADHDALALQAARESIVLLKNDGALPLKRSGRIAVIGPNADSVVALLGNYNGTPSNPVTVLAGMRELAGPSLTVNYAPGCKLIHDPAEIPHAVDVATGADAVVLALGLDARVEGEEGDAELSDAGGDRRTLKLPPIQRELLDAVLRVGKPTVIVLMSGGAIALDAADPRVSAILQAWYPGQRGGQAVAEVLFGDVNPSGRLPVTFYQSDADLSPFINYSMESRTYRYFRGAPLFPFGHGLSYTHFEYDRLALSSRGSMAIRATFVVTNAGEKAGDEVVQVFVQDVSGAARRPVRSLAGFARVHLRPGESKIVEVNLPQRSFSFFSAESDGLAPVPGRYVVEVGASSADIRLRAGADVR